MIFHIVAVGRVRDAGLSAACEDYAGRVRHYAKLEIHEVPDGTRRSKARAAVLREEAEALRKAVPRTARLVALSRSGRSLDSRAFAAALDLWRQAGRDLAFVVGGAYGLDESLQQQCDEVIRLSDMTLPHELARLVLLEQIYRGNTILKGGPYHKGD
jgi:23S rRNA (pseudouridine1915-N3)-methyltransferase